MAANQNQPVLHETVTIPIVGRPQGMRVLSVHDDANVVPEPSDLSGRRQYLGGVAESLVNGTVGADGHDALRLYWRPMSWTAVREILAAVNKFADFSDDEYGMVHPNPLEKATLSQQIAGYRRLDKQDQHSLLRHRGNAKAIWREAAHARGLEGPRAPRITDRRPVPFPVEHFDTLLLKGVARRTARSSSSSSRGTTWSGGIRPSATSAPRSTNSSSVRWREQRKPRVRQTGAGPSSQWCLPWRAVATQALD